MRKKEIKKWSKIYVPSSISIYPGVDEFIGGIATVQDIIINKKLKANHINGVFITIAERPKVKYNLHSLLLQQKDLAEKFGTIKSHITPGVVPNNCDFTKPKADWH